MDIEIEIEKTNTWPHNFADLAFKNKKLLLSYHLNEKYIYETCKSDAALRTYPLKNEYRQEYDSLVSELDSILNQHNIIAYHSTRLTKEEIADIKKTGMKILSSDLVQKRLSAAHQQGYLSQNDYEYLLNSPHVQSSLNNQFGKRTEFIWFSPNKSTLKEYLGVKRLFQSWGGEAVYGGHEQDQNISLTLKSIGMPCIIKCTMPFSDAKQCYQRFAERFLSFLISNEIECPEPSPDFDMWIDRNLSSNEILEVIDISNPLFEELTNYSRWNIEDQVSSHQTSL